jgi:hypothetical protein
MLYPLAKPLNGTVQYYSLVETATGTMVLFIPFYWRTVNNQVISVVMIGVSAGTYHLCVKGHHVMLKGVCIRDGNTCVQYNAVFSEHLLFLIY